MGEQRETQSRISLNRMTGRLDPGEVQYDLFVVGGLLNSLDLVGGRQATLNILVLFSLARGVQTVRKVQTLKKKMEQNKTCLNPVAPTQRIKWR